MTLDPSKPPRPGRIIVPGEPEPPAPEAEEPARTEAPRIILPPGVEEPSEAPDLPDRPRLRPLAMIPIRDADRDYLLVTDPMGVLTAPVALRLEVLELMQLLDGSLSLHELGALVARESKDIRATRFVRDLVAQLDRLLLLDSPRFHRALAEARASYHALEIRPAALEGLSYPADPGETRAFVEGHFEAARKLPEAPAEAPATAPRAILSPHLDPRRSGPAIARGLLELPAERSGRRLRVVVFGVGHSLFAEPYALTRKHFETPFGKLLCDTAFVDAMAERLGEAAYRGELSQREEHSIEFQALYLKHRFGDQPVEIVPILCAGFHAAVEAGRSPRETEMEALVEAVREAERRLPADTVYLASVDLSHVGPRFGDPAPDERITREVEEKDRAAIEAARRADADGWHEAIASHQDSTRVCGWGATWAMLRLLDGAEGRLLHYEQSKEPDHSFVSIATMVWR